MKCCESISLPSATPSPAPSPTRQPAAGPELSTVQLPARRYSYAVPGFLSATSSTRQSDWRRQRRRIIRRQNRSDDRRAPRLRQPNGRDRWHTGHSRQDPEADVNRTTDYADARTLAEEKSWFRSRPNGLCTHRQNRKQTPQTQDARQIRKIESIRRSNFQNSQQQVAQILMEDVEADVRLCRGHGHSPYPQVQSRLFYQDDVLPSPSLAEYVTFMFGEMT